MSNYVIGYDEDGNPMYADDQMGPQLDTAEYSDEDRQADENEAASRGMDYDMYMAWKFAGNSDIGDNTPVVPGDGTIDNVPVGGLTVDDNQSQAEVDRLNRIARGESSVGTPTDTGAIDWDKIAKQFGIKNAAGDYDWKKILGLTGGALATIGAATQTPVKQLSIAELKAGMPAMNTAPAWTEEQLAYGRRPMQSGSALQRVYAADMQSPVSKGQTTKMADGGEVMPGEMSEAPGALSQAFAGAVQGSDGGQSDMVSAMLSPGEYVLDAETVSALGDGNTQAGIAKLDELRAKLREQKRGAPTDAIPPQAMGPLSYMQQGA